MNINVWKVKYQCQIETDDPDDRGVFINYSAGDSIVCTQSNSIDDVIKTIQQHHKGATNLMTVTDVEVKLVHAEWLGIGIVEI